MAGSYTVKQGDHLSKIAKAFGFSDYHTIWDHPQNADLKQQRKNANVLFPGDSLFIPDRQQRVETCSTDKLHKFQAKKPALKLRLALDDAYEKPIANASCLLVLATSTFLHATADVGLPVIARLKDNLPELAASVKRRFESHKPHQVLKNGTDRIEFWDAEDFAPWETLHWERVRVLRYRQHQADGTVVEAEWLTNLSQRKVPSLSLYQLARSRWEIENQGFNDCKSRQGLEHICHHHTNSLLICWLLTLLALVLGRFYRVRFLHRGNHAVASAIELVRLLWLGLGSTPRCRSA